jgi:hypothetical protein
MRTASVFALLGVSIVTATYNECPAAPALAFPQSSRYVLLWTELVQTRETSVGRCRNPPDQNGFSIDFANSFTISYKDDFKVLTNRPAKRQYILYPCGNAQPDASAVTLPSGYQRKFFTVPLHPPQPRTRRCCRS